MRKTLNNIKEILSTWRDYAQAEKAFKKSNSTSDTKDHDFLPAALEIQETPPSPMSRVTLWILCLFVVIAITWSIIGKVDIVAVGQGKIIPSGHVKVIQPLETGIVKAIHVSNGERVKKGDVLLELDITQTDADRIRLEKTIPIAREKLKITESLYKKGVTSKFDLLTQQESLIEMEQELAKATSRVTFQKLIAPVSGIVQQLQIHTIGGVVTPAQELMKIVPVGANLEAEILLENKDIGFVEEGQDVHLKLEAFPFTKYGMIDGEVVNVSHDAIQDEELGLVFAAKVAMKQSKISAHDKMINLSPGMSLSGEIKTGDRRIIEYFLSPIMQYKSEAIRER